MLEQHFTTPNPIRLEITVLAGAIEVSCADDGESTLRLEGAQRLLDQTRVEQVGSRLIVSQGRRRLAGVFDRVDGSLHLHARVPRGSHVAITTASGDAVLDGSFAGLDATSASGSVRVSGELAGDASVKTVSGDARLARVSGDLNVRTVSGDVHADAVDGSLTVKSVSGDVRVGALRAGTATVRSVSGDVELGVAAGTNLDLDAGSASGALSSEVPLSQTASGLAGPTLVLRATTVSGDVRVLRAG